MDQITDSHYFGDVPDAKLHSGETSFESVNKRIVHSGAGIRMLDQTRAVAVHIVLAKDVTNEVGGRTYLLAGPPLQLKQMNGATRGALIGGLIFEGEAETPGQAEAIIEAGDLEILSLASVGGVGALTGIVTPRMPVVVVRADTGIETFAPLNEGLGKVLRFGAYGEDTLTRLRWLRDIAAPILDKALSKGGPLDITDIQSGGLRTGDECHNRNVASTSALFGALAPELVDVASSGSDLSDVMRFITGNPHFFLSFSIAASKAVADSAHMMDEVGLVTAIAFNGHSMGIRVSGCGDRWFLAPSIVGNAKYFDGFTADDAGLAVGDSAVCEVVGLGACALSAAPALVLFTGADPGEAVETVAQIREISRGTSSRFLIPYEGFEGTPIGLDVFRIRETGISPIIDMGVAHRRPGVGQIGAGVARLPLTPFIEAAKWLDLESTVGKAQRTAVGN